MGPVRLLLGVALALVACALPLRAEEDEDEGQVLVPAVEDRTLEKATVVLEAAGLETRVIQVAGPAVDVVASQRPGAGARVPAGTTVFLRVGIRARIETQLPDVLGRRVEDALELLAGAYDVHVSPRVVADAEPGTVVASEPRPGATLYYRASLVLHVAEAPAAGEAEPAAEGNEGDGGDADEGEGAESAAVHGRVPCGVGETPEAARHRLEEAGYRVRVERRWAADAEAGHVVAQDPPADRPAPAGTLVTLFLPEETAVPSVVGLTSMDAVRELALVGLAARFDRRRGRLDARVVAQRPDAGAEAVVGSPVVLRFDDDPVEGGPVWQAPPPRFVVVPDVRGKPPAKARAVLGAAGLSSTLDTQGRETPGPVVTAMSHAPYARLREGATVTLVAGPFAGTGRRRGPDAFAGAAGLKPEGGDGR